MCIWSLDGNEVDFDRLGHFGLFLHHGVWSLCNQLNSSQFSVDILALFCCRRSLLSLFILFMQRYPVLLTHDKYSRLSLSRLRLSRATAYLEEKI